MPRSMDFSAEGDPEHVTPKHTLNHNHEHNCSEYAVFCGTCWSVTEIFIVPREMRHLMKYWPFRGALLEPIWGRSFWQYLSS